MFKTLIAPVQGWLLTHGQCVGCGMPLRKGLCKKVHGQNLVVCRCGRGYFELEGNRYRRARMSEMAETN